MKPPKAEPRLAIDDPLRVRLLKKPQGSDDEAEARFAKQRALIDAYKKENPGASTNKVFSELEKLHPSIFRDTDDDSEMDQQAKASHHVRWTRHAS